ncbi:MAG: 4-(cytidine 5'-diphospho)-2-C-methyl-D-erythritol kinase [Solirubrobacterales bacterium]|nr:MAG: 4-(cytidine 5'-diphospho)-2-C-methyl-D-erythritol kinase [Solirubrobacterales bacterium]
MRLRALAPGKVNLCLFLGGRRADGRHELVTLLQSVSLADELELVTLPEGGVDEVRCPGVEGPNLVSRALAGLRARGWDPPAVRITIRKRIPVAGGMGGGSADAAAALRLCRVLDGLGDDLVYELARELGADVPSQLAPGLVLGTGAGDVLEPVQELAQFALLILPQPFELSAAEVYREADRLGLGRDGAEMGTLGAELRAALRPGRAPAPALLVNDLQPAALSLCPSIGGALAAARAAGAEHALVSGSGPTVAGLYWGADAPDRAGAAALALAERFPGASSAVPFRVQTI